MKKIKYSIAALSIFMAIGCTSDEEGFNENKDRSYVVPAETLVANAQRELADQMVTPDVNLSPFRYFDQYWAATQYPTESRYNLTQRTVPDNLWNNLFRDVLGNLESAKAYVAADAATTEQKNKLAVIEIMQVYTFQVLVDTFGDIPYSDALQPSTIVLPRYDNDAEIYPQLITRLDAAIDNLDDSAGSFTSGDLIYNGDVAAWRLFANSLKIKLGLNIADVDNSLAQSTIESAVADGVILTNADNATFAYDAAPVYNPLFAQLVASNRNDFVASNTIVDRMNALNDPRRPVYFQLGPGGVYVGGVNGAANIASNFSGIGDIFRSEDFPGILFEATEVNFYLAEAAARGYSVGGTAETYYNAAIEASFEYWGVGDVATYLANPAVAYATAPGTWQEKIGGQAWIAFFNRSFEGWNVYRRLDVPTLTAATGAVAAAEGKVPIRFTYPINEATVNSVNLQAAITAMGGNKLQTRVFWDVD